MRVSATRRFFLGGSSSCSPCGWASSLALARLPLDDSATELMSLAEGIVGKGALRFAGVGEGVTAGDAEG